MVSSWERWKSEILKQNPLIDPNFFVSFPYLESCGAVLVEENGWMWWEADGFCLFPPIHPDIPYQDSFRSPIDFIWSGFKENIIGFIPQDLDWEYIYDPKKFLNMSGGCWSVFRKNVRKWPRKNPNFSYIPEAVSQIGDLKGEIQDLLVRWLKRREKDAQDPEVLIRMGLNPPIGTEHSYLMDGSKLASLAIWDRNWKYINFRFLITRGDPFLDEFSRLCFYKDIAGRGSGMLVNDGGSLGKSGLEVFKDKLHPVRKIKVHSWRRKQNENQQN